MEESRGMFIGRSRRVRSAVLVICALILFLAGVLLLFAPASARGQLRRGSGGFPLRPAGGIMGAQSREPVSLAGD
jgi:hypothetical protein